MNFKVSNNHWFASIQWRSRSATLCRLCPLLLVAGVTALVGCEASNEYEPPPPPEVTVQHPIERDVQEYFRAVGQTRAAKTVELRSRVGGYLSAIKFEDTELDAKGQPLQVTEGQLLFVIDQAPYKVAVESAKAALEKAEANLELANQQLDRTEPLVARNAVSESELDQVRADQASALADVNAAKAALDDANLNLSYTEIKAPFAGRIGRHLVDIGNLVQPNTTLLARLQSVSPMHAYYTVSEADLLHFQRMQESGELQLGSEIPVDMSIGSDNDYRFHGRVDFFEFGVDPGTGTTECRATFSNEDGRIEPGLFVNLRVKVGEKKRRLLVPEKALGANQRGDYLLVVNEENKVELRTVKLGESLGDDRVILSGIDKSDQVIVVGLQRARVGSLVDPQRIEESEQQRAAAEGDKAAPDSE